MGVRLHGVGPSGVNPRGSDVSKPPLTSVLWDRDPQGQWWCREGDTWRRVATNNVPKEVLTLWDHWRLKS